MLEGVYCSPIPHSTWQFSYYMDFNSEVFLDSKMQNHSAVQWGRVKTSCKDSLSEQAGPCGDPFVSTQPQDEAGALLLTHCPERRRYFAILFLPQYSFGHLFQYLALGNKSYLKQNQKEHCGVSLVFSWSCWNILSFPLVFCLSRVSLFSSSSCKIC